MARNVKKIPFPDWLAKTECTVKIKDRNLSEDGECKYIAEKTVKCIFSECIKRVTNKDGNETLTNGKVIIKGDIAPGTADISSGVIVFGDNLCRTIVSGIKAKNPDSSVHHCEFFIK